MERGTQKSNKHLKNNSHCTLALVTITTIVIAIVTMVAQLVLFFMQHDLKTLHSLAGLESDTV